MDCAKRCDRPTSFHQEEVIYVWSTFTAATSLRPSLEKIAKPRLGETQFSRVSSPRRSRTVDCTKMGAFRITRLWKIIVAMSILPFADVLLLRNCLKFCFLAVAFQRISKAVELMKIRVAPIDSPLTVAYNNVSSVFSLRPCALQIFSKIWCSAYLKWRPELRVVVMSHRSPLLENSYANLHAV